jgi:preprotein translocase SecE subunit
MAITTEPGAGSGTPSDKPRSTPRVKPTPGVRGGPINFLRETIEELRKVVWPTGPELFRYTVVVLLTVVVLGALIFGIDSGLHALVAKFIVGNG